jgi:hypothetical protein
MATQDSSGNAAPDATAHVARELKIEICPLGLDFWEFLGARAQLEAEAVIPADVEWPQGAGSTYWQSGKFKYWLRRVRPSGLKGPMKLWANGDWWCLRCDFDDGLDHASRSIRRKERELARELYRHSAKGRREMGVMWSCYHKAQADMAFQEFKAKIPGLMSSRKRRNVGLTQALPTGGEVPEQPS